MSILARLVSPEARIERRTLQSSSFVPPPQMGVLDDFVGVHRSMANMTVFACVRLLADTIASLPWKAYRRDSKGVPKEVNPQPKLITQPYPGFDLFQWKWMTVAAMALRGNSYHYVTSRDNQGRPTALLPLHPDVVFLERRPDILRWFEPLYRIMGEAVSDQDMVHMRRFTMPGEPWGMSPIRQAAVAIGMGLAAEEYGYRYFKESANPSGTLSTEQNLDADAIQRLQTNWIQSQGGRRLPAILTNGFKWETLSISPNESQFLECVVPGTPVTMADGMQLPVEQLGVGDEVMSWDGSKLVAAKVKAVGTPPVKPMVKLTTARGRELICTADHPVLAQKLRLRSNGRPYRMKDEPDTWVHAGNLQPGQRVRIALGHLGEKAGHLPANVAYFLGAMVGDGRIHNPRRGGSPTWSHDQDQGAIDRMADVVDSLGGELRQRDGHPYECRVTTGGNRGAGSLIRAILNESKLVGSHSPDRFVPDMITAGGPSAWRAFLSGYFDADGCIRNQAGGTDPAMAFWSSSSRELLEGCQHLLALLGINSSIYLMREAGRWVQFPNGTYTGQHDEYTLRVCGGSELGKLAAALDLGHGQKSAKLANYLDGENSARNRAGQFEFDLVKDVCWLGDGQAVGVEIEGTKTFVTSGIITHNTRQFQRSEICLMFGVPPILIGDTKETTAWGTGVEQITLGAVTYTFRPWTSCIESVMSACLPGGQFVRFDYNALLRGNMVERYSALKMAIEGGFLMPNEARAGEEMDPADGGDHLLQPANFVPMGFPTGAMQPKAPASKPGTLPMPAVGGGEAGGGSSPNGNGNGKRGEEPFAAYHREIRRPVYPGHGK